METPIVEGGPVSDDAEFAAAIAGFGQLLRGSDWLGDWGWDQAIALAAENRGDDPFGYRNEAVTLMRLAESLSEPN
jgi:Ca-activated chloride channel family protein